MTYQPLEATTISELIELGKTSKLGEPIRVASKSAPELLHRGYIEKKQGYMQITQLGLNMAGLHKIWREMKRK